MDAEEKKLLPSSESGSYSKSATGFKLHFFPDIAVDNPDNMRVCLPPEDRFQRTRYSDQSNCADLCADPEDRDSNTDSPSTSSVHVKAYQEGFQDGLEKGQQAGETAALERATRKLEPLVASLQQALARLKNLRQDVYGRIEMEVVELALAIARKVICREVKMDKEIVVCVAREALTKVEDPARIKIKMNPGDLQFINETKYQLADLVDNIENVTLAGEESVQSGGCVIETNLGEIDARIENQLQAVEESFRSAFQNSGKKTRPATER